MEEYKTMYAKLNSIEEYEALNNEISNHPLKQIEYEGTGTTRYAPENPTPVDGKYYMLISAYMQELYPERAAAMELVEQIPASNEIDTLEVL